MALSRKLWRHVLAMVAMTVGALLLWLSPEEIAGLVTLAAGIALEAIGVRLDHA